MASSPLSVTFKVDLIPIVARLIYVYYQGPHQWVYLDTMKAIATNEARYTIFWFLDDREERFTIFDGLTETRAKLPNNWIAA